MRIRRQLLFLFAGALAASTSLSAQSTAPPLAGIAHVALRVHSLDASRAFYQALGFEQAFDLRRDNVPYESFIKINDSQFIELYPVTEKDPDPAFLHLCFEGDDLQAIYEEYSTHGLTPTAVRKAGAGNLLFTLAGPPQPIGLNNKPIPQNIEYTQYQPDSLHTNDLGKHLGADRISDRLLGVALAEQDPVSALEFYTNQLDFKPLPGEPLTLHLPGNSGQQLLITPATLGPHARILFDTMNLARAKRHLAHEHIPTAKLPNNAGVLITDPDGNQLLLLQR